MSLSKMELLEGPDQHANGDALSTDDEEGLNNVNADEPNHALDISLILQKILSNLPLEDLLRCSFVNSQWNYEAKRALNKVKKDYCGFHWFRILESNLEMLYYLPEISITQATVLNSCDLMEYHDDCNGCAGAQNVNAYRTRHCQRHFRSIPRYGCDRENCPGCPYLNFFDPLGLCFYLESNEPNPAPKIRRKRFKTNFIPKCKANYIVPTRRTRKLLHSK